MWTKIEIALDRRTCYFKSRSLKNSDGPTILRTTALNTVSTLIPFKKLLRYRDLSKIVETLGTLKEVARHYDAGYLATITHCLKLHLIARFTLKEIFRLGLADPAAPPDVRVNEAVACASTAAVRWML